MLGGSEAPRRERAEVARRSEMAPRGCVRVYMMGASELRIGAPASHPGASSRVTLAGGANGASPREASGATAGQRDGLARRERRGRRRGERSAPRSERKQARSPYAITNDDAAKSPRRGTKTLAGHADMAIGYLATVLHAICLREAPRKTPR